MKNKPLLIVLVFLIVIPFSLQIVFAQAVKVMPTPMPQADDPPPPPIPRSKNQIVSEPKTAFDFYNRAKNPSIRTYEERLADITKAIELEPANALYYFTRGDLQINNVKADEQTITDLTRAIELETNITMKAFYYLRRGDTYKLGQDYFAKLRLPHFTESEIDYSKTLADYMQAVRLDPKYYTKRGELYLDMNKNELALADFTKAISYSPLNIRNYQQRAYVNAKMGKTVAALKDLSKIIDLDPADSHFYLRGSYYFQIKRYKDALHDFNRAIELSKEKSWKRIFQFARAQTNFELGDYKAALSDCNEAIDIDPSDYYVYILRVKVNRKLGNKDAVQQDLDKAKALRR
jgi:tetratricopeptide (TPR) repeat protein